MTNIQQFGKKIVDKATEISELSTIGFYDETWAKADILNHLIRQALPEYHSHAVENDWLTDHLATLELTILDFLRSRQPLTIPIFYTIAAQLLGFDDEVQATNFDGRQVFKNIGLATTDVSDIYHAWYVLLNTHTKNGLMFVDELASHGYFKATNQRVLFNGKSLVTYDMTDLIQETVWVETTVDSDNDGQLDLVQVDIQRPRSLEKLPVLFTASPYYQGMMVKENDAKIHDVNQPLTYKTPTQVSDMPTSHHDLKGSQTILPRAIAGVTTTATKTFTNLAGRAWDLNNYFLSRGFAVAYAAGVGTRHSDGMQDTGSPEQVESMKNVVEWLAGNRVAFTDRTSQVAITADWSNHKIAMTGRSYLGTLATAVATTGVEGLKTIISEAAISDWYQYYRDNGLVIAPGGFPGEDMDVLAELVYSRMQDPADWLRTQASWHAYQNNTTRFQDRQNGNYDGYWDARNYLNHAKNIKVDIISVHGLNDWNVKPRQIYRLWQALQDQSHRHKLILHQGQHININNNRSLDFADQINLWFSDKLLDLDINATAILPTVTWQDNTQAQTWYKLNNWGISENEKTYYLAKNQLTLAPAGGEGAFTDYLPEVLFKKYTTDFNHWRDQTLKQEPELASTQQHFRSDFITKSQIINGESILHLRVKSSQNIGLISAMLIDYGDDDYLKSHPTNQNVMVDRGVNFAKVPLQEFEVQKAISKMITIGHINLQNRTSSWQNDALVANEYVSITLKLQPTLYTLRAGHRLGLIIYATDFEMTIRGNQDITYTIDYENSQLTLPQ
ncbi:Xaa-Pro dipeptidyl-peptidase [Leuconostoc gelidum subsp. aenigmaticum]|uniref:Xaa-Pro dipeptidyl-peptidase n=1 Tax=Leuconostoc gelidum TaxID=1244 RepID=UPI001CC55658|nr:Xaa-Pro dipeptidyl-peptidase [Leuconostoc gelidum]MBZ6002451.1 Xaa-Pro dipeptidyl-peptidase [Leuconostoc gelidum subsp. aenigmaticum]